MRSEDKLHIEIRDQEFDGEAKPWAFISPRSSSYISAATGHPEFAPSFEDQHRIIGAIVKCEILKYSRMRRRSPGDKVREFVIDSVNSAIRLCGLGADPTGGDAYDVEWESLSRKHMLPARTREPVKSRKKKTAA